MLWPCYRFGYVEFPSADVAKAAYDTSEGLELHGRSLHVDFARELSDRGMP